MKDKKSIQIGFSCKNIRKTIYEIENPIPECSPETIELNIEVEVALSYVKRTVTIRFMVFYECNNAPLLTLGIDTIFDIIPTSWAELSNNNTTDVLLPNDFIAHLITMCIGTVRGYLLCKLENTPLAEKIMLPLMDAREVMDLSQKFIINKPKAD